MCYLNNSNVWESSKFQLLTSLICFFLSSTLTLLLKHSALNIFLLVFLTQGLKLQSAFLWRTSSEWFWLCCRWRNWACCFNWALFSLVISWLDCHNQLATIIMQLSRIGTENTSDINIPLVSKYCWFENKLQLLAAISFILSEKYTKSNNEKNNKTWKLLWFLVRRVINVIVTWNTTSPINHGSCQSILCRNVQMPSISSTAIRWGSTIATTHTPNHSVLSIQHVFPFRR